MTFRAPSLAATTALLLFNCGGSRAPFGGSDGDPTQRNGTATGGAAGPAVGNASNGGSSSTLSSSASHAGASGGYAASTDSPTAGALGCGVPTSFKWNSSAALIAPQSDSTHTIVSVKDPTVVYYEGKWHVYATAYDSLTSNYNMVYLNFADFSQAQTAQHYYMDRTPGFSGYLCAPQIFYFAPQAKWYLIYQTQPPAYSTNADLSKPENWTSPKTFFPSEPAIVTQNKGDGFWIDFWVICDDVNCHLFFSDDNGHLYRSQTAKTDFPNGFGAPVIVMSDTKANLFEAANVYRMKDSGKYLLIVEAMGNGRYFRSWTADTLEGSWTALAGTQAKPFAGKSNVTGATWSNDGISHGEMLRDGIDETLTIDTCNLQYLFQGRTKAGTSYNLNEYSLGLLTAAP